MNSRHGRYDEHDDDDDDDDFDKLPRRSRRPECPYCGSREAPIRSTQVSQGGWVTLVVFLLFCWPLFWIGLLMTEEIHQCYDCRARLD